MEIFKDRLNMVREICSRYEHLPRLYKKIKSTCKKTLMSIDRKVSLYGMFLPDKDLEYAVLKYKGKLTTDADKANYKYYFDENDRLVLTERHYRDDLDILYYIFYFYKEDCVEIVWYRVNSKRIYTVAKIQYEDHRIQSFFETENIPEKTLKGTDDVNFGFREFSYHYGDGEVLLIGESRFLLSPTSLLKADISRKCKIEN